ncbi:MAG: nicotinamide riboside transporter PnuC [Candidatus Planktophila sp.]|jgi:nicotinamide mononucleotide transporter|tara:strand:- start:5605 stop:6195 length:591 start_codon:yes stop_codon:yes gene_type:complete
MFSTFFTAWEYQVSYLEFIASIVSFIGVALGITARRITWPWWALSSALYAIFFLQYKLYASAALQLIFIAAAIAGWYGWAPTGAKPGPFKNRYRVYTIASIIAATLLLAPILKSIGAASTYVDAILFFGSVAAQLLMVYEKYDSWPMWLVVDAGYVALYASQGLLFTTLLYVAFTLMAALGWRTWYGSHKRALRSL